MRILVLSALYPPAVRGGYEVECANVVEHLRASHDVLVVTSSHRRPAAVDERVLRKLPLLEYRLRDSVAAPIHAIRAAALMRRILGAFEPELIYVWNGSQIPQAALRVAETAGRPVAYRVCERWFQALYRDDQFMRHLMPGERGLRGLWARLMRVVNRHPALALDVSTRVRAAICWNSDLLRDTAPTPPTVQVLLERKIYPATKQSTPFALLERRPSALPTLLFMGRVAPDKGPTVAYEALARLRDDHGIQARLVLAGPCDDGMRRELTALAERLDVVDRVTLAGQLAPDELGLLLEEAHVVLIPSTLKESAPLVCTEAALARVPVVASWTGGISEMLHDGEHALLFPPGDGDACARATAAVLMDLEATAARVERAFERVQLFTFERYLQLTDEFLAATMQAFGLDAALISPRDETPAPGS